MTEYKLNKWYPHAMLAECPVHPESKVSTTRLIGAYPQTYVSRPAGDIDWETVVAFRVNQECEEPLVLWVNIYEDAPHFAHTSMGKATISAGCHIIRTVKVMEVKE